MYLLHPMQLWQRIKKWNKPTPKRKAITTSKKTINAENEQNEVKILNRE